MHIEISHLRIYKAPLGVLAIQRRPQRDNPEEIRKSSSNKGMTVGPRLKSYYGLRGRSLHIQGSAMAKARRWAMAVLAWGTMRSSPSADPRVREETAKRGLRIKSQKAVTCIGYT